MLINPYNNKDMVTFIIVVVAILSVFPLPSYMVKFLNKKDFRSYN